MPSRLPRPRAPATLIRPQRFSGIFAAFSFGDGDMLPMDLREAPWAQTA